LPALAFLEAAERLGSRTATLVALLLLDGLKLGGVLAIDIADVDDTTPEIVPRVTRRQAPVLIELHRRTARVVR
jgi:hypothetical protein